MRSSSRLLLFALSLGALAALLLPFARSQEPTPVVQEETSTELRPSKAEARTSRQLVAQLDRYHYGGLELDDALSERLLERYLRFLDPTRAFLLAEDVARFEGLRDELDDALRSGEVGPAFRIYELFQERRMARLEDQVAALDRDLEGLSFDVDESLEVDREKAPWATSPAELDELWRKLLKDDVLELRLVGRTNEEIHEVLSRRYAQRVHRAGQVRDTDVFSLFLNSFTSLLDPHTSYFPPRDAENFDISMSLSLEGIGALIGSEDGYSRIEAIIPGGPAERGGELQATDRILGVAQGDDGEMVDVRGWRNDEVVDLIRGKKGTVVRLQIVPGSQPEGSTPREVRLVREEIKLEDQAAKSRVIELERDGRSYSLGVIELPTFYMDFQAYHAKDPDYRSATRDVARLVAELGAQGVDGIVLDLRGNGGGSLLEAQELSGLFLGPGPVVQIRDYSGRVQVLGNDRPSRYDGPLAVLVDRLSASASEIFAAAVQDRGRGLVLGGRTFGKGTVQEILPLSQGQLKITQAKFYRSSGGSTQDRGVEPDIAFPATYDDDEIGESALDDALPWDRIEAVVSPTDPGLTGVLAELRSTHDQRVADDPDFRHAVELRAFAEQQHAITMLSLDEAQRRQQREEIQAQARAIENRWREAKGMELLTADEETPEGESSDEPSPTATSLIDPHLAQADAYQREACEVLADLIAAGATAASAPWIVSPVSAR